MCWFIAAHHIINTRLALLGFLPKEYEDASEEITENDAEEYLMQLVDPEIKDQLEFKLQETSKCSKCNETKSCD